MRSIRLSRADKLFALFLLLYFGGNLLFLTRFPFIHSDESWLAGLSRAMLSQRSLAVTEPFFDLKPRYPHAIKSLFHLLQMPLIAVLGYTPFAVRLLSLLGGCTALSLFYSICKRLTPSRSLPLLGALLLAADAQFLTAAHFARQEILLCAAIALCLRILLRRAEPDAKSIAVLAIITGLCVGLHPNSFMLATMCGAVLLTRLLLFGDLPARRLLLYIVLTGGIALLFVAASFWMDPQFPAHYLAYGESEFDLLVPLTAKFGELSFFFQKLFHRVSGTYFVPEIKAQLLLLPVLSAVSAVVAVRLYRPKPEHSRQLITLLCALAGLLLGTVVIGRYNQTGFVFFVIPLWLLLVKLLALLPRRAAVAALAVTIVGIAAGSAVSILPWLNTDYDAYLDNIGAAVPSDARVLGNLNSEFYFENGALLDIRNLSYLKENEMSVEDYIRQNKIEYLILSQELDFIYSVRPKWNMIYGNLRYMEELHTFTDTHCERLFSFTDNTYGVRIREQMNTSRDFAVTIYKVK